MPVEVKQMIVNSTLVSGDGERGKSSSQGSGDHDLEALREEVIEECRELIEQSLNRLQER